jgi:GTP cyclohydrolase IA
MTDVKRPSRDEAEEAIRNLLRWIGEDDQRKGLLRTPTRVLGCYDEWFGGYKLDPREILGTSFPEAEGYNDIVVLKDVDFESHCEHHIAPFIGKAHIAYLPSDRVVGVSKLVKVVQALSKRLQVQEKLTQQIADCINDVLQPRGVAVILEAQHECMTLRWSPMPCTVPLPMIRSFAPSSWGWSTATKAEYPQIYFCFSD